MRLIDNHRQVVSSEKGAVDTSARYHQRRVQKADPSSADNPNSKLAGQFPASAHAITMEIKSNPNNPPRRPKRQLAGLKFCRHEKKNPRVHASHISSCPREFRCLTSAVSQRIL